MKKYVWLLLVGMLFNINLRSVSTDEALAVVAGLGIVCAVHVYDPDYSNSLIKESDNIWSKYSDFLGKKYEFSLSNYFSAKISLVQQREVIQNLYNKLWNRSWWDKSVNGSLNKMSKLLDLIYKFDNLGSQVTDYHKINSFVNTLMTDGLSTDVISIVDKCKVIGSRDSSYPLIYILNKVREHIAFLEKLSFDQGFICLDFDKAFSLKEKLYKVEEAIAVSYEYAVEKKDQKQEEMTNRMLDIQRIEAINNRKNLKVIENLIEIEAKKSSSIGVIICEKDIEQKKE